MNISFSELGLPHPRDFLGDINHRRDIYRYTQDEVEINGSRYRGIDVATSIYVNYRLLKNTPCITPGCLGQQVLQTGGRHCSGLQKKCAICLKRITVTHGTIFYNKWGSHWTYWLELIFEWSICGYGFVFSPSYHWKANYKLQNRLPDLLSERSIILLAWSIRKTCSRVMENFWRVHQFGPFGRIVIDESDYACKRKYQRGRLYPSKWVLGIKQYDTPVYLPPLLVFIRDQTRNTIEAIIRHYVRRGSEIWHDDATWYMWLNNTPDYDHRICSHSQGRFIAPDGTTTNSAEGLFGTSKQWCKILRGIPEDSLPGYLDEYMYRRIVHGESVQAVFRRILRDLGTYAVSTDFLYD